MPKRLGMKSSMSAAKEVAATPECQPVESDYTSSPPSEGRVSDDAVMQKLWGSDDPMSSTSLDNVRDHAQRMLAQVQRVDPHTAFISVRSKVQDVRLFQLAHLVAETALDQERCDFRGMTRVPGSIDTVMEMLASDDERESYWVALNTQRGLLVNSLFASRRLDGNAAFPRWNQRYTATKYSKHTPPVECCFNEYAAFHAADEELSSSSVSSKRARLASVDTVASDGTPLRRAFIYRRSMDHRLFNMEDVQEKLSQYGEPCERLYYQDYLLEVSETSERHICKVVLTCSAFITDHDQVNASHPGTGVDTKRSQSMRHEFREACATMLQSVRHVLSNQWRDQMEHAGVLTPTSVSVLKWSLGRRHAGQPAYCGVCSASFSLLRKRNLCRTCSLVMCSRCCTKPEQTGVPLLGNSLRGGSSHDLSSHRTTKECILCAQFGAASQHPRVSVSIRRHFTSSVFSSARSLTASSVDSETDETVVLDGCERHEDEDGEEEEEEVHVVHSAEDLDDPPRPPSVVVPAKPVTPVRRNLRVRSSTEDISISSGWRTAEVESELPPRSMPTRRRFKQRCESVHVTGSSASGAGIVLLTDIETLSLTGSFHRVNTSTSGSTTSSRRGSNLSDSNSNLNGSFVRVSPPLPPTWRSLQSSSDEAASFQLDGLVDKEQQENTPWNQPRSSRNGLADLDDLANFNLKLL